MLRNSVKSSTKRLSIAKQLATSSTRLSIASTIVKRSIQTSSTRPSIIRSNNVRFTTTGLNLSFARNESTVVKVPEMAESITEGTLSSFSKQVGEYVAQDETLATIETDKIDVEVNAPVGGIITELLVQPDDTVVVGQEIAKIEPGAAPEGSAAPAPAKEEPKKEEPAAAASTPAAAAPTPAKEAPAPKKETPAPKKEAAPKKEESPKPAAGSFSRHEERIKMNRMRLRIAERLKEAQNTAASLTTFNEVDMSSLLEMRKLYKDEFLKKTGIKFGFMGAFSRACALAMKDIPAVNGAIENGDTMVYRDYVDISVAMLNVKLLT
ncbi:unnamed protein product [[Candida] boidinii]|nr:unnamed protein product [[Candida] boidinii]